MIYRPLRSLLRSNQKTKKMSPSGHNPADPATSLCVRVDCFRQFKLFYNYQLLALGFNRQGRMTNTQYILARRMKKFM